LRAHQAEAIAALRDEKGVVFGLRPEQGAYVTGAGVESYNVSRLQMRNLADRMDARSLSWEFVRADGCRGYDSAITGDPIPWPRACDENQILSLVRSSVLERDPSYNRPREVQRPTVSA